MEKVQVKIYGQEHIISGDKTREHIERVAAYVDERMKQLSNGFPSGSVSELASLAAVNITDEMFASEERLGELRARNEQLEGDTQHYIQLWEEAKKSFLQYKEESQKAWEEKAALQSGYNEVSAEADALMNEVKELKSRLQVLEQKNDLLSAKLSAHEEGASSSVDYIRELETKTKELERNYFDLQMENTRLKGEVERYRRLLE
ncbi:MAG: cell division protein ZapA [Clostridiales Family XIII bacterium]|jgi:cell division protein ZapA|nr:cell division protein ZapA [Clostridiales Family XIII bacterium]